MKKYETIFIINDRKVEDEGKEFTKQIEGVLKEFSASSVKSTSLGRKQFARPINKMKYGIYLQFNFTMNEDKVKGFQEHFALNESVVRVTVFKDEKPETIRTLDISEN